MKTIAFSFLCLFCLQIQAQNRSKKLTYGAKLGTGISFLSIRNPDPRTTYEKRAIGIITVGGRLIYSPGNNWEIMGELNYSSKGGRINAFTADSIYAYHYEENYVSSCPSLGLHLLYIPKPGKNFFFLGAGPTVDFNGVMRVNGYQETFGCNLVTGYRFDPGFSIEFNLKKEFSNKNNSYTSNIIGLSLAYTF